MRGVIAENVPWRADRAPGSFFFFPFQLTENSCVSWRFFFPWAWAFFVPFIVVTSFAVLNLFIGIIVDAMHIIHGEDNEEDNGTVTLDNTTILEAEIKNLRRDIMELRESMDKAA